MGRPAFHLADRPAVPVERGTGRDGALEQFGLPVPVRGGWVDLAEDDVDHPVEEVRLVGDVVVERHRLDFELLGELAHRQLLGPALVGQDDRRTQDAVSVERHPFARGRLGCRGYVVASSGRRRREHAGGGP